jgi:hypothetical protein
VRRVGGFLVGLGVFFLVLFVISDSVLQPEFGLLAGGVACLGLGIFLIVTNPVEAPPPSPRFRVFKRRGKDPQPRKEPMAKPAGPPPGGGGGKPGGAGGAPGGGKPPAGAGKPAGAAGGGKPPAGKPPAGKPAGPPGGKR